MMNNQHPCEAWAEKLAARHQADLTPQEHLALQAHLATCAACAAQYRIYQDLEARIRALPSAEPAPSFLPTLAILRKQKASVQVPAPLFAGQSETARERAPDGKRFAVIIGVNAVSRSSRPALPFVEHDAQEVAALLQSREGFELPTPALVGETATTHNILLALARLADQCKEDDEVIFYYSGHGGFQRAEDSARVLSLHTYDWNDPGIVPCQLPAMFTIDGLHQLLGRTLRAKRVLLILDCCYAGGITEGESDQQFSWTRERTATYFEWTEGLHQKSHGSLTLIASAVSHEILATPDAGASFSQLLRRALSQGDIEEDRVLHDDTDLQQVYHHLVNVE